MAKKTVNTGFPFKKGNLEKDDFDEMKKVQGSKKQHPDVSIFNNPNGKNGTPETETRSDGNADYDVDFYKEVYKHKDDWYRFKSNNWPKE